MWCQRMNEWEEECTGNKADQIEERISELEDRYIEMVLVKRRQNKIFLREEILQDLSDYIGGAKVNGIRVFQKGKRGRREKRAYLNNVTAENLPNPEKELDIQVHEANRTPYYLKQKDLLQDTLH